MILEVQNRFSTDRLSSNEGANTFNILQFTNPQHGVSGILRRMRDLASEATGSFELLAGSVLGAAAILVLLSALNAHPPCDL